MTSTPLAFTAFEVAWGISMLAGFAVSVLLIVHAARARIRWMTALLGAVLAVFLPFAGPLLALLLDLRGEPHLTNRKAFNA